MLRSMPRTAARRPRGVPTMVVGATSPLPSLSYCPSQPTTGVLHTKFDGTSRYLQIHVSLRAFDADTIVMWHLANCTTTAACRAGVAKVISTQLTVKHGLDVSNELNFHD